MIIVYADDITSAAQNVNMNYHR